MTSVPLEMRESHSLRVLQEERCMATCLPGWEKRVHGEIYYSFVTNPQLGVPLILFLDVVIHLIRWPLLSRIIFWFGGFLIRQHPELKRMIEFCLDVVQCNCPRRLYSAQ
jgi:hypothetical protein